MTTKTNTASRTATVTATGNPLDPYKAKLAVWPGKYAGPKPTAETFKLAHQLGARPGTKTAMAIAMYLRPDGATQGQVFNVNGGPYLNKMRALVEAGLAHRQPMPVNADGHTVYKLALPAKAKAKAARKAKAKATDTDAGKATDTGKAAS